MPPETTDNAAEISRGPVLRDPLLGIEVPVYLGGDGTTIEMPEGDRGDGPSPEPQAPSPEPKAPETPEAKDPETKGEEAKGEEPPPNPVERKRDPDTGKFVKAEGEETQGEEPPPRMIPKERLDKEIEKRKILERQLAEKNSVEKAETEASEGAYDFDAAEKRYMDAILDGKLDDAASIRREIRTAERADYERLATQQARAVTARNSAEDAMEQISSRFEKDYPAFDPESDDYDAAAIAQAKAVFKGYLDVGIYETPVEAFEKALQTVVAVNGWQREAAVAAAKGKPVVPDTRTAAKRVEAITSQPASIGSVGESGAARGATDIDVSQLTEAQLAKLPEATLRRLRGDEL